MSTAHVSILDQTLDLLSSILPGPIVSMLVLPLSTGISKTLYSLIFHIFVHFLLYFYVYFIGSWHQREDEIPY